MPSSAPGRHQRLRELLGADQDHRGGEHEHRDDGRPPGARGERAEVAGGSHQVRLLGRRAGHADRVEHEDRDEDQRVEQRDRVLQRQGQRVDRGDGQEGELDRVAPVERDALPPLHRGGAVPLADLVPGDEDDHRPADADQQPVGAGHVGEGEASTATPPRRPAGAGTPDPWPRTSSRPARRRRSRPRTRGARR